MGSSYPFAKDVLAVMSPLLYSSSRYLIAGLFLLAALAVRGQPMQALGQGVMDIPALLAASAGQAEWLIVELDECATDMLTAVQVSYQYLIEHGLGR